VCCCVGAQDQIKANPIAVDRSSALVAGGKNRMITRVSAPLVDGVPQSRLAFLFGSINEVSNELIAIGFGFQPYVNDDAQPVH
jgi:hypothetical protein